MNICPFHSSSLAAFKVARYCLAYSQTSSFWLVTENLVWEFEELGLPDVVNGYLLGITACNYAETRGHLGIKLNGNWTHRLQSACQVGVQNGSGTHTGSGYWDIAGGA
jgi:hypothetical protein